MAEGEPDENTWAKIRGILEKEKERRLKAKYSSANYYRIKKKRRRG